MQKPDFLKGRKGITFVDLFAGAGGFSEGFMQAYTDKNYYDFIRGAYARLLYLGRLARKSSTPVSGLAFIAAS